MKVLALDIGDRWVGIAISDSIGMTCRPLETVGANELENFLSKILKSEKISKVVVGLPVTMKGTESEQTKKIKATFQKLKKKFSSIEETKIAWILYDERLSSQRAEELKGGGFKTKEEKVKEHSIAAAFILQDYLNEIVIKEK